MEEIIEHLQDLWNTNADKAKYMICGTIELDEILLENELIMEAIKILNGEGLSDSTPSGVSDINP